ncbi:hypothetical protein [Pseudarthrobacter sp. PS3-L1]|uniref:hypothetical protein n=1 Tax=Pseudarthrobacter sp. PS3-L1 TaxID=3046207 RepID=UPI0024BB700A|nr:hypothetical protein [Pseudarthrobacter sp. PS3-L1]MDJ0321027.1 hypothetical protein [Pseudarthrobacter sp. PS3-L1]
MAIWGADIQQLKDLGQRLVTGAQAIEDQKSQLTKALAGTDWKGPDADRFRNEWSGQHTAALNKVAAALKDAGQQAKKNAQQQETASS